MKARKTNAIKRLQSLVQTSVSTGQFSVSEIVEKTGLPQSYVYKLLRGDVDGMTVATVERVCGAIGVSPAALFDAPTKAPAAVIQDWERVGKYLRGK